MRRIVADQFKAFRIFRRDKRQFGIAFERAHQIEQFAVDFRRERFFCQRVGNTRGHIIRTRAVFIFSNRAVGKRDFNHLLRLLISSLAPDQEMGALSKPNLRIAMEPKRVQISFPSEQDHIRRSRRGDNAGRVQTSSSYPSTLRAEPHIQRQIRYTMAHDDNGSQTP